MTDPRSPNPEPLDPARLSAASSAFDSDRRAVLSGGLAAGMGLVLWGCGGGREPDVATPPRLAQQTRPAAAPPVDPRPRVPATEPEVRVLVGRLDATRPSLRLEAAGGWIRVRDSSDRPGTVLASPLEVSLDGDRWRLAGASGPTLRVPLGPLSFSTTPGEAPSIVARLASNAPAASNAPSASKASKPSQASTDRGTSWALGGAVSLVPQGGDRVDLVATLPIEQYLPGVLAKELYANWTPAAFRAQAIAARSFAVCEASHWANRRHYDLTTGPDTQAWGGLVASGLPARATVETRGLLLVWDDRVVPAYYSSCCGGLPADAVDAISSSPANGIAPLAGRDDGGTCCEWAPTYRWNRQAATGLLTQGLAAWGRRESVAELASLDGLRRLEVSAVNRHGRPTRFRIESERGLAIELKSERARRALAASMPSGGGGFHSAAVEPRIEGAVVSFRGRGHGHGVGLCQYGAEAMARAGASGEAILRRYYPGATVAGGWS